MYGCTNVIDIFVENVWSFYVSDVLKTFLEKCYSDM